MTNLSVHPPLEKSTLDGVNELLIQACVFSLADRKRESLSTQRRNLTRLNQIEQIRKRQTQEN